MPNTFNVRPRFMKVRAAAEYLGIGRTSLKQLVAEGVFPGASKIGTHHLIPIEDLDCYADRLIAAGHADREKGRPNCADGRTPPHSSRDG
jgi:excisionase family DNA binding protein